MEHQLDCVITKVYEAKKGDGTLVEGKGDYGKWKLYTFHTDTTGDKKFGFMWDKKKPLPIEGLKIKHMEYEVKKEGKYTNYNVKKLELPEDSTPEAIPNTKEDMGSPNLPDPATNKDRGVYVSYATTIAATILTCGGNLESADLDEMVRKIAKAGIVMMNESLNTGQISTQESVKGSPVEDKEKPVPSRRAQIEGNLEDICQGKQ